LEIEVLTADRWQRAAAAAACYNRRRPMTRGLDLLLQAPFLAGLDVAELDRIPLRPMEFASGQWILTPRSASRDLFLLADGTVEILEAFRPDRLRRVTRAHAGDTLGEHRREPRPPAWGLRAASPVVVFRWPAEDLDSFLKEHPRAADGLRFLTASRRLAARMNLDWLGEDEVVYAMTRKHLAVLARAMIVPLGLLSAGLGITAIGGLDLQALTAILGGLVALFGAGLGVWRALDWRNDYYVATDRRILWIEKVIGIYDNRQESPLRMILSVEVDSGLLGRQLDFGDLEVRTYTGSLTFRDTPYPEAFAATIESLAQRLQRSNLQSDRETIHAALENRLVATEPREPTRPLRPPADDEARRQDGAGLDHWSFQARFEEAGVITYRKHLAVLFQHLLLPSLLLLLAAGLAGGSAAGWLGLSGSRYFFPALGASAVGAVLWWLYEFADWANELYQITPTHIVAVHKKPLGRESRKVAPLENILGTQVDRRGPIGLLLNFGDVVANVGTASFVFEGVLNPSAAQQDIVRAQESLVDRKMQGDRKRRQDEMVEWLAAYHERTAPPSSRPPDPDAP
jgi:CRP-like cAMP-binding protein